MMINVFKFALPLFQVRLPGAPPQLHLLLGASGSAPGLLPLPRVAAGKYIILCSMYTIGCTRVAHES